MELRHLRYFVAVAEEMNIHRAAKRLNISQPPLSLTIQQLEEEIDTLLFERVNRSIKITRAGEHFLDHAKKILHDTNTAKQNANLIGLGKQGILKIGFISSAITGILQKIVQNVKSSTPDIELNISQSINGLLGKQIIQKEYDIGIVRHPEYFEESLIVRPLTQEHWCIAVKNDHKLAKRKSVSIKEISTENIIFYPRHNNPAGYDDVMNLFQSANVIPNIYQEAPEQMTIAALVTSGLGIGIVPACMANIKLYGLTHIPIQKTKNRTGFSMIYRDESDPLIKTFLDNLDL